jgi:hypothetical protein
VVRNIYIYGYNSCGHDSMMMAELWKMVGLQGIAGPRRRPLHLAGLLRRQVAPLRRRHEVALPQSRQRECRGRAGHRARPRPHQEDPRPGHSAGRQPGLRRVGRGDLRLRGGGQGSARRLPGPHHEDDAAAGRGPGLALGPSDPGEVQRAELGAALPRHGLQRALGIPSGLLEGGLEEGGGRRGREVVARRAVGGHDHLGRCSRPT